MLVNLNTALEFTEGKKRAVAAFNVFGYEDAKAVAKDSKTNVCVHLDHCTKYSMILRSILRG